MGPATFDIHTGLPNYPIFFPVLHKFKAVVDIKSLYFVESLNINAIIFIFMNEHFLICFVFVVLKQVHHVLVVKLEEGAVNFDELTSLANQAVEDMIDCPGDQASVIFILFQAS